MRKAWLFFCLLFVLYGAHAAQLQASNSIEPLGGLSWQDTLTETIVKLNRMDTITGIYVQESAHRGVHLESIRDRQRVMHQLLRLIDSENAGSHEKTNKVFGIFHIPVDSFIDAFGGGRMAIIRMNRHDSSPPTTHQRRYDEVYQTSRFRSSNPYRNCQRRLDQSRHLR
ncbi:MAG: hypothetical protein V3S24_04990, partial [Candidatus Tectomicrobia bacterium]